MTMTKTELKTQLKAKIDTISNVHILSELAYEMLNDFNVIWDPKTKVFFVEDEISQLDE